MKKIFATLLVLVGLSLSPYFMKSAIAQPPPPVPKPIPIDGGLSLLVAAGVAYGARKVYKSFKEKE